MISYDEALNRIHEDAPRLSSELVELQDSVGRVLAEDLICQEPIPAFDYSAMDGYAFAFADLPQGSPFRLPVVGISRPGGELLSHVQQGTACRILTGAPLPLHADTVVPQEDVDVDENAIVIRRVPQKGRHIRRRGDDLHIGALAISRGTKLEVRHMGLCAALDRPQLVMARRPRVAILTTGDELRSAGSPAVPGSVVDGNGPMICALVNDCGGIANHRHVADDLDAVRNAIRQALEVSDLVLTIGGISVGSHDHVRSAIEAEGVILDFWKVAIKPGKPVAYGRHGQVRILGLPGNPAAAFVTATIFTAPLLRAMQGHAQARPAWIAARAAHDMVLPDNRDEFARANVEFDADGQLLVSLLPQQASGSTVGIARANALAWLVGRGGTLTKGEPLRILRL